MIEARRAGTHSWPRSREHGPQGTPHIIWIEPQLWFITAQAFNGTPDVLNVSSLTLQKAYRMGFFSTARYDLLYYAPVVAVTMALLAATDLAITERPGYNIVKIYLHILPVNYLMVLIIGLLIDIRTYYIPILSLLEMGVLLYGWSSICLRGPTYKSQVVALFAISIVAGTITWADTSTQFAAGDLSQINEEIEKLGLNLVSMTIVLCVCSGIAMTLRKGIEMLNLPNGVINLLIGVFVLIIILFGIWILHDVARSALWAAVVLTAYPIILGLILRPDTLSQGDIVAMYKEGVRNVPLIGRFIRPRT